MNPTAFCGRPPLFPKSKNDTAIPPSSCDGDDDSLTPVTAPPMIIPLISNIDSPQSVNFGNASSGGGRIFNARDGRVLVPNITSPHHIHHHSHRHHHHQHQPKHPLSYPPVGRMICSESSGVSNVLVGARRINPWNNNDVKNDFHENFYFFSWYMLLMNYYLYLLMRLKIVF
jgi:hypothetical protein